MLHEKENVISLYFLSLLCLHSKKQLHVSDTLPLWELDYFIVLIHPNGSWHV